MTTKYENGVINLTLPNQFVKGDSFVDFNGNKIYPQNAITEAFEKFIAMTDGERKDRMPLIRQIETLYLQSYNEMGKHWPLQFAMIDCDFLREYNLNRRSRLLPSPSQLLTWYICDYDFSKYAHINVIARVRGKHKIKDEHTQVQEVPVPLSERQLFDIDKANHERNKKLLVTHLETMVQMMQTLITVIKEDI